MRWTPVLLILAACAGPVATQQVAGPPPGFEDPDVPPYSPPTRTEELPVPENYETMVYPGVATTLDTELSCDEGEEDCVDGEGITSCHERPPRLPARVAASTQDDMNARCASLRRPVNQCAEHRYVSAASAWCIARAVRPRVGGELQSVRFALSYWEDLPRWEVTYKRADGNGIPVERTVLSIHAQTGVVHERKVSPLGYKRRKVIQLDHLPDPLE